MGSFADVFFFQPKCGSYFSWDSSLVSSTTKKNSLHTQQQHTVLQRLICSVLLARTCFHMPKPPCQVARTCCYRRSPRRASQTQQQRPKSPHLHTPPPLSIQSLSLNPCLPIPSLHGRSVSPHPTPHTPHLRRPPPWRRRCSPRRSNPSPTPSSLWPQAPRPWRTRRGPGHARGHARGRVRMKSNGMFRG